VNCRCACGEKVQVKVGESHCWAARTAAIKGQKAKQAFAIAMKDVPPFGIAGTGKIRQVASGPDLHNRMPAILDLTDFDRWLGVEPDPRDALKPFPSELLKMWPISTRVNSPMNDDEHLLEEIELTKTEIAA
jgi:putative SOS response-associated peptidase YedK